MHGLGTPKDTPQANAWLEKVTQGRVDPIRDRVKFDPVEPEAMTARLEATLPPAACAWTRASAHNVSKNSNSATAPGRAPPGGRSTEIIPAHQGNMSELPVQAGAPGWGKQNAGLRPNLV